MAGIDPLLLGHSLGQVSENGITAHAKPFGAGFVASFSEPPSDPSLGTYRHQSSWFNHLVMAHRLAIPSAKDWLSLPIDHGFAISSMHLTVRSGSSRPSDVLAMRFLAERNARGTAAAVVARYWARGSGQCCRVEARFQLVPAALAGFIRRGRNFADFDQVSIDQPQAGLVRVRADRWTFVPGESDRLVDGNRVDHVPALILIDRSLDALEQLRGPTFLQSLSARFMHYADPRHPIEMELDAVGDLHLHQNGEEIARLNVVAGAGDRASSAV